MLSFHKISAPFLMIFVLAFCGCGQRTETYVSEKNDTLVWRHASLLSMVETDSFTFVSIENPWKSGSSLHRYVLVPHSAPLPQNIPEGTVIRTPLKRAVAFTSVHASLLCDFNALFSLIGVCDAEYIMRRELKNGLQNGSILDLGKAMQPNTERIVSANCDALLVSPFQNNTFGVLEDLNIPIVECADYMERSPLARAEWMRFYGRLFGQGVRADSLFAEVEKRYLDIHQKAKQAKSRPRLMIDMLLGSVWYVPGGNSTMGRIYQDAGADYIFSYLPESGSVSLSFETVYEKAHDADLWFLKYGSPEDYSYKSLRENDTRYADFRPWQQRHVYGCNTSRTPFYDDIPFHPDVFLNELVAVCHPELCDSLFVPRYIFPLK